MEWYKTQTNVWQKLVVGTCVTAARVGCPGMFFCSVAFIEYIHVSSYGLGAPAVQSAHSRRERDCVCATRRHVTLPNGYIGAGLGVSSSLSFIGIP